MATRSANARATIAARLALGIPVAAALGLVAQWPALSHDLLLAVVSLVVGLSFLATGVLVSVEPGQARAAAAFAAAGVLWPLVWARAWAIDDIALVPLLAVLEGPLAGILAAWALLHYPTPWASRRHERVLIGLLAATQALVLTVVVTAEPVWHGLPPDTTWLPAWPHQTLYEIADIIYHSSHGVLSIAVAVAFPLRIRRLAGPDRHIMMPVSVAVAVGALATVVSVPIEIMDTSPEFLRAFRTAHQLCLLGIPLAFLLAVLRRMFTRNAIWLLADRLRSTTDADMVQLALREALTDPTLEILYWMPDTRGYVDTAGKPRQAPEPGDPTLVGDIRAHDGEPLARIVGSPALLRHPQLARPAERALALSLANTRLHAEIRAQIARIHHSQQRLPGVVEAERRRIEDDIAGGARKHLDALGVFLGAILGAISRDAEFFPGAGDTEPLTTRALRTVRDQLPVVQDELRDLVRGLVPGVLAEAGLRAAVADMAEALPLPIQVDLPPDRFDRDTENAAYFMISEALANTVKHAGASRALVRGWLTDDRLHLEVTDDGEGGANPAGHGLAGITDRIEARGGDLRIDSTPGRGTRLTADLPR